MPYKLRITKEEIENELEKMGFKDYTEEIVESFRKDLLKLIKNDIRKLRQLKDAESHLWPGGPQTEGADNVYHKSSSVSYADLEKENIEFSERTSLEAESLTSEATAQDQTKERLKPDTVTDSRLKKEQQERAQRKKQGDLPSYPEKPDPVNLYHFYKAHWDKYKPPGEDARSALRWDVRTKLFYSS